MGDLLRFRPFISISVAVRLYKGIPPGGKPHIRGLGGDTIV